MTRYVLMIFTGATLVAAGSFLMADDAPTSPAGFDTGRESELRRGFEEECDEGTFPVTWPVFEMTMRPFELESGTEFLPCFDFGDDSLIDSDGDGVPEMWTEDGSGYTWDSFGGSRNKPLTAMRRSEGVVAIEVVMNFEGDLQYWLDVLEAESTPDNGSLRAEHDAFFDVDGDGRLDLIFKVGIDDWDTGNSIQRFFWFRNTSVPPGRNGDSDLNGDGRVDGEDLLQLLSDWSG
jgi:hypothetical protein